MTRSRLWIAAAISLALLCGVAVSAIEKRPLPAFDLIAMDGNSVVSTSLVKQGKWLLVYGQIGCVSCDALFRAIDAKDQPLLPERMVIVVGGVGQAGAAKIASAYPQLKKAQWFADPSRSMNAAVKMPGAPVTFGLRNDMLEWEIAGVIPNVAALKSALISWAGEIK